MINLGHFVYLYDILWVQDIAKQDKFIKWEALYDLLSGIQLLYRTLVLNRWTRTQTWVAGIPSEDWGLCQTKVIIHRFDSFYQVVYDEYSNKQVYVEILHFVYTFNGVKVFFFFILI